MQSLRGGGGNTCCNAWLGFSAVPLTLVHAHLNSKECRRLFFSFYFLPISVFLQPSAAAARLSLDRFETHMNTLVLVFNHLFGVDCFFWWTSADVDCLKLSKSLYLHLKRRLNANVTLKKKIKNSSHPLASLRSHAFFFSFVSFTAPSIEARRDEPRVPLDHL